MIILWLSSPLCHMPDLSVGRAMQLALLTINQPEGWGGVAAMGRDGEADAGQPCITQYNYMCRKKEKKQDKNSWLSIPAFPFLAQLLPRCLFCLLLFSPPLLVRRRLPPSSVLKASNIHHPLSPNTLRRESSGEGSAGRVHKMDEI